MYAIIHTNTHTTLNIAGSSDGRIRSSSLMPVLVGYNACRHIVWGHYVLREGEKRKCTWRWEQVCSHNAPILHSGVGGWVGRGRTVGLWGSILPCLCDPGRLGRETPERTLPVNTHNAALAQAHEWDKAGVCPSGLWIFARAGDGPNVHSVHVVWIVNCHAELKRGQHVRISAKNIHELWTEQNVNKSTSFDGVMSVCCVAAISTEVSMLNS